MSPIPEGFTSVTPYVMMDDTAAAIEFYKKALGATEKLRLPAPDGNVVYAEIKVGNAIIMMGNCRPGGSPVSFFVYVEDVESAFKKAKDAGMSVKKEIEDMFWGDRIGTLTDPFNVDWTIAQHIRDVSPEEMQEAMKKMAC